MVQKLILLFTCLSSTYQIAANSKFCAKSGSICIPENYSKFDLPNETLTVVHVGIDIKDIPKINDKDFSVTLNAFFVVRWTDRRLIIDRDKIISILGDEAYDLIPVDVSFIKELWLPDAEILNLKEFKTLTVLSKLEGLWINMESELMHAVAARIEFICPMTFETFPLDVQTCFFQVGSFNYDSNKMIFMDELIADETKIRSVLDYSISIEELPTPQKHYTAITGNFSVAGFKLTLKRKVSHYIITCYLPSGMFVIVSWISFLIPPDIVPGRMTLLITVFLVLVNIFNTITTNIPKAEGLTAIEAWVIVCVLFVFGALVEYAGILLRMKVKLSLQPKPYVSRNASVESQVMLHQSANGQGTEEKPVRKKKKMAQSAQFDEKNRVAKLDLLFLVIFPILFLIFNLVYWFGFINMETQVHYPE